MSTVKANTIEPASGGTVTITGAALTTPALGTPASATLTNCTGLPIGSGVSGLGASVANFLATPSSANLAAAVTDETGSGALVFANTPTFDGNIGLGVAPTAGISGHVTVQIGSSGANYAAFSQKTGADAGGAMTWNAYGASAASGVLSGFKYRGTGDKAYAYVQANGGHYWGYAVSGTAAADITFTEGMGLDDSGRFRVGTTSVIGSGMFYLKATASTNGLVVQSGDDGNYLFNGKTAAGSDTFRVVGNGNVTNTNNSYGAISDAKLKRDVTDTGPKLSKVLAMRIVNYYLKADPTNTKLMGMIAQELREISPGLVEETPDYEDVIVEQANDDQPAVIERRRTGTTTLSIKYSVLVPMLVKALQEMHADFDSRLRALEAKA